MKLSNDFKRFWFLLIALFILPGVGFFYAHGRFWLSTIVFLCQIPQLLLVAKGIHKTRFLEGSTADAGEK